MTAMAIGLQTAEAVRARVHLGVAPDRWWAVQGICNQSDPEAWFPEQHVIATDVKRMCQDCPVVVECATWAILNDERFGIWGGLSEKQRRVFVKAAREGSE